MADDIVIEWNLSLNVGANFHLCLRLSDDSMLWAHVSAESLHEFGAAAHDDILAERGGLRGILENGVRAAYAERLANGDDGPVLEVTARHLV